MIDRDKHTKQLPDGRHVCGVHTAAKEYGATPPAFMAAAKKAGLTRYAARTAKGQVAHFWLVDEVEKLKRQRFGAMVSVDEEGPFVEAPYDEVEGN